MCKLLLNISLLTFSLACASVTFASPSLRCDSRLVVPGNTRDVVRNLCGIPTDISSSIILRRVSLIFSPGSHRRTNAFNRLENYAAGRSEEQTIQVPVETWVYNFGPQRFMQRLRFVDGVLEDIDTLDYGYSAKD